MKHFKNFESATNSKLMQKLRAKFYPNYFLRVIFKEGSGALIQVFNANESMTFDRYGKKLN